MAEARCMNFINGEWTASSGKATAPNINPANFEEQVGTYQLSEVADVLAAVDGAKAALGGWKATPAPVRGQLLQRAHNNILKRSEELAKALTLEEGKTLNEARGEVQKAAIFLDFAAGEGRRLNGETIPSELPRTFAFTTRSPLGVVGLITPWNFPVAIPVWKIAPALVCGNTVVFKPASLTPWTAQIVVECFAEAGLPPGVLNLVTGSGSKVGQTIVEHPDVVALSFTGSNEVGTRLYTDGARKLKKVQAEMGGKNPVIILDDADVELAAVACCQGAFGATGQRCTATSRVVVDRRVADHTVEKLLENARKVVVGNGMDAGVTMGPSVDEGQHATVLSYIDIARSEGAELLLGGKRPDNPKLANGYFTEATIFDQVKPDMRIAREEVFGPVLSVIRVDGVEEAFRVANNVDFGLTSSVYTRDIGRVFEYVDEVETGMLHVNSPTVGGEGQCPFGGVKATGVGQREMGHTAMDFYTELKTVYIDYTGGVRTTNIY